MLKECLEVFQKDIERKRKQIIDSYVPDSGTYIIVTPKGNSFEIKDSFDIKYNKKEKELEGRTNKYFKDVCQYDYNSRLINMNKPVDSNKIIHSNNFFSFFIKKESLTNGKLKEDIINNYYEILKNPIKKYEGKKKAVLLYKEVEKSFGKPDVEVIEKIEAWIKDNIFNMPIKISGKDYLKIFFDYPVNEYIKEGKRYFIPNIYNNNEYNVTINNRIFGLPNNNMGLNSKKPYLENKTRKNSAPYLIDDKEVQLQKEFFDYLMNAVSVGKVNVFVNMADNKIETYENGIFPQNDDFYGIFLRIKRGKEGVEIHNYDEITCYKKNIKRPINFKNILQLDLSKKSYENQTYGKLITKDSIQKALDEVFFAKYLINNYFTDAGDITLKDNIIKNNLLLCRNAIFNWLYKGIDNGIGAILDKASLNLIKGAVNNGYIPKAGYIFNLRWAFKEYFEGGIDMADIIQNVKSSLRHKINMSGTDKIENDNEYYFAIGQTVSYLLSKSKGKKKPHSLANQFLNCKNNDDIKEKLRKLYVKYSYDPDINSKRFNNLYAMIIGYLPEGKVNNDLLIGGYLNSNLIYEKKEEEK